MKTWNELYRKNNELDDIFDDKYKSDNEIYQKNCIEFLVELSEFLNETKCFKYWSVKEPKYDEMLEELADVFTMLMYFYNTLNLDFDFNKRLIEEHDLFKTINDTYKLGTELYDNLNKELLDNILYNIAVIMNILNIKEDDLKVSIDKKEKIIEERLNSNY